MINLSLIDEEDIKTGRRGKKKGTKEEKNKGNNDNDTKVLTKKTKREKECYRGDG